MPDWSNTGNFDFVVCMAATATAACSEGRVFIPGEVGTLDGASNSAGIGSFLNITNTDLVNEGSYSVNVTG